MNRTTPPLIKDAVNFDIKLTPYRRFYLDNGVPVYTIDAGAEEVIKLDLAFSAGNAFSDKIGIAYVTNFLLKNGTKTRTAFEINEAFDYYGAYCSRSCYAHDAYITVHALSRHLEKLLPILVDMVENPTFPQNELDIYIQNSKQRLEVNLKKCAFVADRLIDSYVYGAKHPYGEYIELEDLDHITRPEIEDFYHKHYVKGGLQIFVSGKLPHDLDQMLNQTLGKLNATAPGNPMKLASPQPSVEKKYRILNEEQAVQGAIRISSPFPNKHHPDFLDAIVLNALFGGFFGSRLMSNIREDKGYTYGIYSRLENNRDNSAWIISTEAGKDVCEATIKEVYHEMERLRNEKVSDQELLLVKNFMMGDLLGKIDGPFHVMNQWENIILNQLSENFFDLVVSSIKNATPERLHELANKYLHPENFYELIVY